MSKEVKYFCDVCGKELDIYNGDKKIVITEACYMDDKSEHVDLARTFHLCKHHNTLLNEFIKTQLGNPEKVAG